MRATGSAAGSVGDGSGDDRTGEARISRRQVITGGGVVAASLGGALLIGCGDDASTPSTVPGPLSAAPPGAPPGLPLGAPEASGANPSAATAADCLLTPEMTEGPYYLPDSLDRRDLREDRVGARLDLELKVQNSAECKPVGGASVEIWHADAAGVYSGFGAGTGEAFLRGGRQADTDGIARFTTIFPGWYPGRAVHIHVKVFTGGSDIFTGQLYFDEALLAEVSKLDPYAERGPAETPNDADPIYQNGGARSTLQVERGADRYRGSITLGVAA